MPNDIDFATVGFEEIPEGLAERMLFRHVHPGAREGQMLVQFVDPATSVRVDVFRASAGTTARAAGGVPFAGFAVVSAEDAAAHALRIAFDLVDGVAVDAKYVDDAVRLRDGAAAQLVDVAWAEHRKARHPMRYEDAFRAFDPAGTSEVKAGRSPIAAGAGCEQCVDSTPFGLADPATIVAHLGYL